MRALLQRVTFAELSVDGEKFSTIKQGILVLLGIEEADTKEDMEWLSGKITRLRIFDDENGIMNLSVKDVDGEVMVVSQFTLFASTKKGNRPSYIRSAKPEISEPLYEQFVEHIQNDLGKKVATGKFGAHMNIALDNDGPVTIMMDSKSRE